MVLLRPNGAASSTTIYLNGLWEETLDGAVKRYYALNGQTIAVRDSATGDAVTYLHGDQLGSVGLATDALGQSSAQFFRPWGDARGGSIGATSLNFTGQRLDGTGLLYYHARSYDPVLAHLAPDGGVRCVQAVAIGILECVSISCTACGS